MRAERQAGGFSLIEIVIVLAIVSLLAGAASAVALRQTQGNLKQKTLVRLQELVGAMLGDPERGDFGYLGDMGELPDTALTQLIVRGTQPAAVADPVDGIVSGYNGPYLLNAGSATGFVDFWNSAIRYTPGTAQFTSLGPDRTLGTADDIVYPSAAPVTSGTITVIVKGLLAAGGPPVHLRSDEASVAVYVTRASDNTRAQTTTNYTGAQGSGIWLTASAVHLGYHGVSVAGLDASGSGGHDFSGSVSRAVVAVSRGPAVVELMLEEAP